MLSIFVNYVFFQWPTFETDDPLSYLIMSICMILGLGLVSRGIGFLIQWFLEQWPLIQRENSTDNEVNQTREKNKNHSKGVIGVFLIVFGSIIMFLGLRYFGLFKFESKSIDDVVSVSDGVCVGQTSVGDTNWQKLDDNTIYVVVKAKGCGFLETPAYFVSLSGEGEFWDVLGTSLVSSATKNEFTFYVTNKGLKVMSKQQANRDKWHVNWVAYDVPSDDLCAGQIMASNGKWKQYVNSNGRINNTLVFLKKDVSECVTWENSVYFTSIGVKGDRSTLQGASSVYRTTDSSFRLYVEYLERTAILTSNVVAEGWHVNWLARQKGNCTGQTPIGSTDWKQHDAHKDVIYVDVDTSNCDFSKVPVYITSLGGGTSHWPLLGGTSIHNATLYSFRIYIQKPDLTPDDAADDDLTPDEANGYEWHINWTAYANE